ncbi:MAG: hypothetical protein GY863_24900, partial [bacterium]|nr:hypothetical protein [bacterium]
MICIEQGKDGFMWFGTYDGLNRFDGYDFIPYKNDPGDSYSISGDFIKDLFTDSSGNLWIATWNNGLNRYIYERNRFVRYNHDPDNDNSLSSDRLTSITEDKDGNLWIATDGSGINKYIPGENRFVRFSEIGTGTDKITLSKVHIVFYGEDEDVLWIGTEDDGLVRFDHNNNRVEVFRNERGNRYSISDNYVRTVFVDSDGTVWAGTYNGGLNRLDKSTGRFYRFPISARDRSDFIGRGIYSIYEDTE